MYFGELLKGRNLRSVARYMEWFERLDTSQTDPGGEGGRREVWIVFADEGDSLHNLLYTDDAAADAAAAEGEDDTGSAAARHVGNTQGPSPSSADDG